MARASAGSRHRPGATAVAVAASPAYRLFLETRTAHRSEQR